jgi:hypothetical protein
MRMKSVISGFAAVGAIALSTFATAIPASAAPVPSSGASTSIVKPNDVGWIVCSGNICIQRISSIINNEADVKAWAWRTTFTGHFELDGPDGPMGNSGTRSWPAGGTGAVFLIPRGNGYTITGWAGSAPPYGDEGSVNFTIH